MVTRLRHEVDYMVCDIINFMRKEKLENLFTKGTHILP